MKDESYTENSEPDTADMFHILQQLGSQSAQAKLKHKRKNMRFAFRHSRGRSFAHTRTLTSHFTHKTHKASNARKA
jgi:hypothetical protein